MLFGVFYILLAIVNNKKVGEVRHPISCINIYLYNTLANLIVVSMCQFRIRARQNVYVRGGNVGEHRNINFDFFWFCIFGFWIFVAKFLWTHRCQRRWTHTNHRTEVRWCKYTVTQTTATASTTRTYCIHIVYISTTPRPAMHLYRFFVDINIKNKQKL